MTLQRWMLVLTKAIENVNRGTRKYTKTKVQFLVDMSAQKAVYLTILNIEKKWTSALHNWGLVMHQFVTIFENRCRL
jgi:putative transposase